MNWIPTISFKQVETGAKKKTERRGLLKHTCLEHSPGKQVHWLQIRVSWCELTASSKDLFIHRQGWGGSSLCETNDCMKDVTAVHELRTVW